MHRLYNNKQPKLFEVSLMKINKEVIYCTRLADNTK